MYPPLVGRITLQHKVHRTKGYFPLHWWPSAIVGDTWRDWVVIKVEQPARDRLRQYVKEAESQRND